MTRSGGRECTVYIAVAETGFALEIGFPGGIDQSYAVSADGCGLFDIDR